MSSSANGTQRVPAWKRLGLKLKQQPAATGSTDIGSSGPSSSTPGGSRPNWAGTQNLGANASSAATPKRKLRENSTDPSPAGASPYKKPRTADAASVAPTLKKQKSVTFADDTKPGVAPTAERNGIKTPSKKKAGKASAPKKQKKPQPEADLKPALAYLRAWKTSRDTWKFNKNHQTLLVKRVFQPDAVPSEDIRTFYEYIRDMKGYTRQRLREVAMEVRKEDDAARGKEGFPEGTADTDSKQADYDALIEGFRRLGTGTGSKRKRFDEVEFVSRNLDTAVTQRVVKRMRAELILECLSDGEESTDSDAATTTTTTTTTATSKTSVASEPTTPAPAQNVARMDEPQRLLKLENEAQPRVRRRKARVTADDTSSDESSSDSDSDSDSDSASDASGSDSGSDSSSSDEDGGDSTDEDDTSSSDSSDSSDEESEGESSEDSSDSDDEPPSKVKGIRSKAR